MPQVPAVALGPDPGFSAATPGHRSPPPAPPAVLNDLGIRLFGIPFLGIVIPHLTGLFGPFGPHSPYFWLACVWFTLISALLWQGNRFFFVRQRRHADGPDRRWRKLAVLLSFNVLYSAPVALVMLLAWYRFAGFERIDWGITRAAVLTAVGSVVLISNFYEMVDLVQQRERDLLAVARLDRARAEAELLALKSQIDPHFLFNSLHALTQLILADPARAVRFTQGLADVYRYILTQRERDLVPLEDELSFAESYVGVFRVRFGDAVRLVAEGLTNTGPWLIPPISLQVLLENAVKHNALDEKAPLEIRITLAKGRLLVSNPVRRRAPSPPSARVGLANLQERYRHLVGETPEISDDGARFTVVLPLVGPRSASPER
jgi:sensor histidine kinase YesM